MEVFSNYMNDTYFVKNDDNQLQGYGNYGVTMYVWLFKEFY